MLLPAVVASERCSYMTYDYNDQDGRFERMIGYKHCRWGCCWKFTDPCCSAPLVTPSFVLHVNFAAVVGLVVCVLLLLLLLLLLWWWLGGGGGSGGEVYGPLLLGTVSKAVFGLTHMLLLWWWWWRYACCYCCCYCCCGGGGSSRTLAARHHY